MLFGKVESETLSFSRATPNENTKTTQTHENQRQVIIVMIVMIPSLQWSIVSLHCTAM